MTHTANLSGLLPATTYHYVIAATDAAGNRTLSTDATFVTLAAPDTTAPVISALSFSATASTSASVSWSTNESARSVVYFGTTTPLSTGTASAWTDAAFATSHTAALSGLAASTTYYMIVEAKDASGNTSLSSEFSLKTPS
jgi:chitinase